METRRKIFGVETWRTIFVLARRKLFGLKQRGKYWLANKGENI